jgi:DNA-binding PadR family transcriptional regulator
VCIVDAVATNEVLLALLRRGPAHGYDLKRDHDAWFPDAKPMAFGQVYATLGRLAKAGLVEVAETRAEGGPERTVYALSERGEDRLRAWLAEPAGPAAASTDEIVRKTIAALRTGDSPGEFLARQRTAHLRRMRELTVEAPDRDPAARLAREHLVAHLDADLRWLERAAEVIG